VIQDPLEFKVSREILVIQGPSLPILSCYQQTYPTIGAFWDP